MGTHGEQPLLDDSTIHPNISRYQTRVMPAKYFGRDNWGEDGEILQEWTGIMGYTVNKQPIIGEAPGQEGLWICAGFHGHGTYRNVDIGDSDLRQITRYGAHVPISGGAGAAFDGKGKGSG